LSLEQDLLKQRLQRIQEIEALGFPRPTGSDLSSPTRSRKFWLSTERRHAEELAEPVNVRITGRILTIRRMGKAGFLTLGQSSEKLQIYVKKDALSEKGLRALTSCWTWANHRRGRLSVPHANRRIERSCGSALFPL